MTIPLVKVKILDKAWLERQGPFLHLEAGKARRLQQRGLVEILDDCEDCRLKTVKKEKKNIIERKADSYLTKVRFNKRTKKRIGWVQDYSRKNGGAELSNKHLVSIGESLGYEIAGITPANLHRNVLYNSDLLIVNNIFEFNPEQFLELTKALYEKRVPYIKYDHDHREMSRPHISRQLFTLSKRNVFISPEHRNKTVKVLGEQIRDHSIILPLSINTNLYKNIKGTTRKKNTVIIPTYRKCGSNVRDYMEKNKNKVYTFIGQVDFSPSNGIEIETINKQSPEEMVKVYNEHEEMLHLPFGFWAGERIYFEAMLCGCKPVVNENVGHKSWEFENLKDELEQAPFTFWKEVEKCLMGK